MLTRERADLLIRLQSGAYDLLLWLADEANQDPAILSPEVVAALRQPDTTLRWLKRQRDRLPARLLPPEEDEAFAGLLSSFFSTSFHVRHLEFNGRLLEARVTLGTADTSTGGSNNARPWPSSTWRLP